MPEGFSVREFVAYLVLLLSVLLNLPPLPPLPPLSPSTSSQGREASFSALATAPLFAAKIPVGLLSGYLISTYLPEHGQHPDGQTLWLIIGLLTM
jgi:hypothetical protein